MQPPLLAPEISQGRSLPSGQNQPHSEGEEEREEEFWEVSCPKAWLGLAHSPSAKAGASESLLGLRGLSHPLEQGQHPIPVCVPSESLPAAVAVPDCAPHVLSISWENKAGCSSTGALLCGRGENLGGPVGLSPCTQLPWLGVDTPHSPTGVPLTPLPHNFLLHSAFQMQLLGVFCSQIGSHIGTAVPQKPNPLPGGAGVFYLFQALFY